MARRASGISGLVPGISANVTHILLRREKVIGKRKQKDNKTIGK